MFLLRFGLENYGSFRDETELSFVSTSQADEPDLRFSAPQTAHGVLPVMGLWGPNASGKTTLIEAIRTFRDLVKHSFSGWEPESPLPWRPFAMQREESTPTRMEMEFVVDGVRYHYGMEYDATRFIAEWLYFWPKSRRQIIFHRDHREEDPWYFGPSFRGSRKMLTKSTRPNSLFLSCAAQFNHKALTPVYSALSNELTTEHEIRHRGYPLFRPDSILLAPETRPVVLHFLAAADVGVVDFETEEHKPTTEHLGEIIKPDVLERRRAQEKKRKHLEIHLVHGEPSGVRWKLHPMDESSGTSVLLRRLEDILTALRDGGVVLFDEIDMSLHPELGARLIELFTDKRANRNQAQLVFSTHNRYLMSRLRRDEVILVDKAIDGSSSLGVASDYAGVRGRDNIRNAYEQGHIRGVPIFGDLTQIVAEGLDG